MSTPPHDDLRLALYRGRSARIVAVGDYLALDASGQAATEASPSWCTMSLVVAGEDRWGARLSLGALGVLVAQLPQAAARLQRAQPAVVRAAVFDVAQALLLLFEPRGDDVVALPLVVAELSAPRWMPDGRGAADLYAFLAEHRDRLLDTAGLDGIGPQAIDRDVAVAALLREHELGTRAVALLGPGGC